MSPLELVLFGAACYLFGVVSGAVVFDHPDTAQRNTRRSLLRRTRRGGV